MIHARLRRGLLGGFVLVAAVDCALIAAIITARIQLVSIQEGYGKDAESTEPTVFRGYREDGAPINYAQSQVGFAIWYASRTCPYCKRDYQWDKLASQLQIDGVPIAILLPAAGFGFSYLETRPLGADQVAFVDAAWLKRYPLSVTPTLLIFDRKGQLIWYKWGVLTEEDRRNALAAVAKSQKITH